MPSSSFQVHFFNYTPYQENVIDLNKTYIFNVMRRYNNLDPTFLSLIFNMSVSLLDLLPFMMDIRRHNFVVLMSFASCEDITHKVSGQRDATTTSDR
jgi:hypothetical protein